MVDGLRLKSYEVCIYERGSSDLVGIISLLALDLYTAERVAEELYPNYDDNNFEYVLK